MINMAVGVWVLCHAIATFIEYSRDHKFVNYFFGSLLALFSGVNLFFAFKEIIK